MHLPKPENPVFSMVIWVFEGHFPRKCSIFAISSVALIDAQFRFLLTMILIRGIILPEIKPE